MTGMPLPHPDRSTNRSARRLWLVSAVLFAGAVVSALQHHDDTALLFAGVAFEVLYFAESRFDWQQRITGSNWKRALFEDRARTTVLGKLAQSMAFVCLAGFFLVGR